MIVFGLSINIFKLRKNTKLRNEVVIKLDDQLALVKSKIDEFEDELQRTKKISKSDESIKIYNSWFDEFEQIGEKYDELSLLSEELKTYHEEKQQQEFKECFSDYDILLETLTDSIEELFKKVKNFTDFEYENSQIAFDIKVKLKELKKEFSIELKIYEIYDASFEKEISMINDYLNRFEDLQKIGEYTDARTHLKESSQILSKVDINFRAIQNLTKNFSEIEKKIQKIMVVYEEFSSENRVVESDKITQQTIQAKQEEINRILQKLNFSTEVTQIELDEISLEFKTLSSDLDEIDETIDREKKIIATIEEVKVENEKIIEEASILIIDAQKEKNEIDGIYDQYPTYSIDNLENNEEIFSQFKVDYEELQNVEINHLESYQQILDRYQQSNKYLNHLLKSISEVLNSIKSFRLEEIKAREIYHTVEIQLINVKMYAIKNGHYEVMSQELVSKLSYITSKKKELENILASYPLNIENLRSLNTLLLSEEKELCELAELDLLHKKCAKEAIVYFNQFISDQELIKIGSHLNSLFNDHQYNSVLKEVKSLLNEGSSRGDEIFNSVIEKLRVENFSDYVKENGVLL